MYLFLAQKLLGIPFFDKKPIHNSIRSRLYSPPPRYGSCLAFLSREDFRFQLFLLSSTRIELCCTHAILIGALSSQSLFYIVREQQFVPGTIFPQRPATYAYLLGAGGVSNMESTSKSVVLKQRGYWRVFFFENSSPLYHRKKWKHPLFRLVGRHFWSQILWRRVPEIARSFRLKIYSEQL